MKFLLLAVAACFLAGCGLTSSQVSDKPLPGYPSNGLANPGLAPGQNVSKLDGPCCDRHDVECRFGFCPIK